MKTWFSLKRRIMELLPKPIAYLLWTIFNVCYPYPLSIPGDTIWNAIRRNGKTGRKITVTLCKPEL